MHDFFYKYKLFAFLEIYAYLCQKLKCNFENITT